METHNLTLSYAGKSHLFQVVIDGVRRNCAAVSINGSEALFDRDEEGKLHLVYQVGMLDVGLIAVIAGVIEKILI